MTLPLLVALALGTVDYGQFAKVSISVNHAAEVGAYYGSSSPAAATDQAAIRTAVLQDLVGMKPADITVISSTAVDPEGYQVVQVTVSVPYRTLCNFPASMVTLSQPCRMRIRPT